MAGDGIARTDIIFIKTVCLTQFNAFCIVIYIYIYVSFDRDKIYIAPSGVQKERILPEDLFVQDIEGQDLELPPAEKNLKKSQCTPLFMCAYTGRK